MKTLLHIRTRPDDSLADTVLAAQAVLPDTVVQTVTLRPESSDADYRDLVEKVFQADSVSLW